MFKGTKRTLMGAAVIATASAPSAAYARIDLGLPAPAASQTPPSVIAPSAARSEASSTPGFRWDDAGLGAAGTIVLVGAGAGSAAVITRRRTHHTRAS